MANGLLRDSLDMHCRRILVPALAITLACSDSSSPSLTRGSFELSITTNATRYPFQSDSAVWITTPRGLFNAQFVAPTSVPGFPSPLLGFVALQDPNLNQLQLGPGAYALSSTDLTKPSFTLQGPVFQAAIDSGVLVVYTPRADTLFEGRLDAWVTDTTPAGASYRVRGRFSAVPFH